MVKLVKIKINLIVYSKLFLCFFLTEKLYITPGLSESLICKIGCILQGVYYSLGTSRNRRYFSSKKMSKDPQQFRIPH